MNYSSESEATLRDNKIAASVILMITLFGFFCNLFVILLIRKAPSMRNSFGALSFSQAIADCGHQAIFAFYVVPVLTLDLSIFKQPFVMRRVGHVLVICYQVCGYSHVCTSFNRFSSVYLPSWFARVFSLRNAIFLAIFTWTLAIVPTSVFLLHPYFDCHMLFDAPAWVWNYVATPRCLMIALDIHFPTYISIAVAFTVFDILTLWRVYRVTKVAVTTAVPESGGAARKRKLDAIFFWQVCLQGALYVTELVTYFYLATLTTNKWMRFFLTDVIWCICHCGDGVLILSLNRELREGIKFLFRFDTSVPIPSLFLGDTTNSASLLRGPSVSSDAPRQIASSLLALPSTEQTGVASSELSVSQPQNVPQE